MSEAIREADGKGTPVQDRPKKSAGSGGEPEAPPVAEPREKTEQEMEVEPLSFLDEWTADQDYWEDYRTSQKLAAYLNFNWLDERNKREGKKRKGSQIREVRSGNYKGVSYFILKDDEEGAYYSDAIPTEHGFDSANEAEQATKDFIDKGKKGAK